MKTIFMHGLGQNASSWQKTLEEIKMTDDIICPELTELLKGKAVNYENLFSEYSGFCDRQEGEMNLCGLSLGGILAMNYAIHHPEKIHSLVLLGVQYKMPRKLLAFQNAVFQLMPNSMFAQMGFGKKDFIKLSKSMMQLDFSSSLDKIKCPVLILCGEKDAVNRKAAEELEKYLKHAELKIIAEAGHEVNVEAPEKLAEELVRFFWTIE